MVMENMSNVERSERKLTDSVTDAEGQNEVEIPRANLRNKHHSPSLKRKQSDTLENETEDLEQKIQQLDTEIASLHDEGYLEEELEWHIQKLHEYNELKDVAQMVLGKLAELEGVTTKEMYQKYNLSLDD